MPQGLASTFAANLAEPIAEEELARLELAGLETTLLHLWMSGRAAWPDIELSQEEFAAHLGAVCSRERSEELVEHLRHLHGADLYLACACAKGIPKGLVALEQQYLSRVPLSLASLHLSVDRVGEVVQTLRVTLLVSSSDGRPPRISNYMGRASLHDWVRVAARRVALNLRRHYQSSTLEAEDSLLSAVLASEMEYLPVHERHAFENAVGVAFAQLVPEQRRLLRWYFVDQLSTVEIARLLNVHRATVMRRLADARESVSRETRRLLHVPSADLVPLAHLLSSQIDVDLLLTEAAEGRAIQLRQATLTSAAKRNAQERGVWTIVLDATVDEVDQAPVADLLDKLKGLSRDPLLRLLTIRRGSVILELDGSEEGFAIIEHLYKTGQLAKVLGIPILAIRWQPRAAGGASPGAGQPRKTFIGYHTRDDDLRTEFITHLAVLHREGALSTWDSRMLIAGGAWEEEQRQHLQQADVVLLLVSADFLAADHLVDVEMCQALQRHDAGRCRVVPVVVRPCDWRNSPLGALHPLPEGGQPVTLWRDRDLAWMSVVDGLRRVLPSIA